MMQKVTAWLDKHVNRFISRKFLALVDIAARWKSGG